MKRCWLRFLLLIPLLYGGLLHAQSIGVRMTDTTVYRGTVFDLPIRVDSTFSGKEVYSYALQLQFDPRSLTLDTILTTGTLTEAWGSPTWKVTRVNESQATLTIAAANTQPLSGDGRLVLLRFRSTLTAWGSYVQFGPARLNMFNEGEPALTINRNYCYVYVENPPSLSISPTNTIIAKGETKAFSVWGGDEPYTWSVSDTALATISSSGQLLALKEGQVVVSVADTNGIAGVTEAITILPYRLSVPIVEQWKGQVAEVPVLVSDLTGLDVTAGRFEVTFYDQSLLYESYRTTRLALQDYSVTVHQAQPGRLMVAFAGSQPLSGGDTLLTLSFRLQDSPYGSTISLAQVLFNENLNGATTDGRVDAKNNPYMYMYPESMAMTVGQSVSMSLYGAIEPVVWSVSDPKVAEINSQGLLTAIRRGQVTITAVDSAGATMHSDPFTVYDTRVFLPDTSICEAATELYWPVVISNRPVSDDVYAFELSLKYDSAYLSFDGLVQVGTASEGWSAAVNNTFAQGWQRSTLDIACSGTTPVTNAGPLCYLKFSPKSALLAYDNTTLSLSRLVLNEGTPTALVDADVNLRRVHPYEGSLSIYKVWTPRNCLGDTMMFYANVYNVNQPTYQWYINDLEVPGAIMPHFMTSDLLNGDSVNCQVIALDPCILNPILWSDKVEVDVKYAPEAPDSIAGDTLVVRGETWTSYEIPYMETARQYNWSFPQGFSTPYGSSGTSVYVQVTDTAVSGNIQVCGVNECGIGDTTTLYVHVVDVPAKPDSIYGPAEICLGVDSVEYWVTPLPGVTSYVWSLPWGLEGSSDTHRIWVKPSTYETNGDIVVHASVAGIDGEGAVLPVSILSTPEQPSLYGPERLTPGSDSVLYIAYSWDVTQYKWLLPEGLSGSGNDDSLYVKVDASFSGGVLSVVPINACGGGDTAWMNVGLTDVHDWYSLEGPDDFCATEDSVCYRFGPYPGALSYEWYLSEGLTGTSTVDSIWVKSDGSRRYATLSVVPILSGDTLDQWYKSIRISLGKPARPDTIYGPKLLERLPQAVQYSLPYDPNVQGYVWSYPEGWTVDAYDLYATLYVTEETVNGRLSVVPFNGCGFGDSVFVDLVFVPLKTDTIRGDTVVCAGNYGTYWVTDAVDSTHYQWTVPAGYVLLGEADGNTVWIDFADTAVSDTIKVYGYGDYGSGPVRSLFIQVLHGIPAEPTFVTVPELLQRGQTDVTLQVQPVPGATSYEWILPWGFEGHSVTTTLTFNVSEGASSDSVYVKAIGPCGYSQWVSAYLDVKVELTGQPTIAVPWTICAGEDSVMIWVDNMEGAEGYHWIVPPGLTGSSEENYLYVSLDDTVTQFTLQVYAYNDTDTSDTASFDYAYVFPLPTKPKFLVAPTVLTPGMTDVAYILAPDSTIQMYEWELPDGINQQWNEWAGPAYGPMMHRRNDTLLVTVTDTAQSGWIKVFGYGFCGPSPVDSIYVTVQPVSLPAIRTAVYTYPNPVKEVLQVSSVLLQEEGTKVLVYDLYGRQIDLPLIRRNDVCEMTFSGQSSGFYLIVLEAPDHTERVKVLKE